MGIGTSSPGRKLDVIGDTSLAHQNSAQLLVRNLSGENCLDSYNDPITANYPLRFLGSYIRFLTSDAERMRIDSSGNVGIGTSSPAYKLDVPATVQFQGITIGANGTDIKSTTYGPITLQAQASGAGTNSFAAIYTSGSERMRIDSSGNVGIGTASPSQKLQVEGTIYSTSGGFQFPDNTTQTTAATGYTPPTAFSAIGTYAFLYYNGGIVASGGTVTSNGANLFPCDTNIANVSSIASGQVWQCMGYNGGYGAATLWLRTS